MTLTVFVCHNSLDVGTLPLASRVLLRLSGNRRTVTRRPSAPSGSETRIHQIPHDRNSSQFKSTCLTETCSGSEAGSYSRLIDSRLEINKDEEGRSVSSAPLSRSEPSDLIAAIIYDKYSVHPSIRPICTKCCFPMTNMNQVCSNFH